MSLRLGEIAPDFSADTTQGPLTFHAWKRGSWTVLFSHPKDFTPVCTTELGAVARLKDEFDRRGVKVIGLSVSPLDDHETWGEDILETQGVALNFPLIADPSREIAALYDMVHPEAAETTTVRAVFVIGPDDRIKLTFTYPPSTGRNFEELLRVIDSLQLTAAQQVATPADWRPGERVIALPALTDDEARERFGDFDAPRPYLRYVEVPSA
jgi:alkyl hydroperoxide reductase subunit AhpC